MEHGAAKRKTSPGENDGFLASAAAIGYTPGEKAFLARKFKMDYQKAFTVEEANAVLPLLEDVLEQLGVQRHLAEQHQQKLQLLDVLWGPALTYKDNPDYPEFVAHTQAITDAIQAINRIVKREIRARGLRFPEGGLQQGLIDFPTTFEGRWVLLCWQRGEPKVGYWHELNGGYAGRQPISAEHIIQMGRQEVVDDSTL